jgi:peptide deformylase
MSEHEHGSSEHEASEEGAEQQPSELEREARRRIALSQVRQYGDPVLRMRANEVEAFDGELARLAERMVELMHEAEGIGLAATQVGVLRRLFVFNDDGEDRVMVNPVITRRDGDAEVDDEGCLSLGSVRVPVERVVAVTISASDESGGDVTLELEGLSARVVQHELDHLDGTLMIDRTNPESRREALRQLRPRLLLAR